MSIIETVEQKILLICQQNNTTKFHIFQRANICVDKKDLNVNELAKIARLLNTQVIDLL